MKRLLIFAFATALVLSSGVLIAQDNMGNMSSDNAKAAPAKLMHIVGKISDDGKTFTTDKDGKTWNIVNPDAVKGHEGHHVVLSAHVYEDKGEVHVMSLKMAKDNMKKDSSM